MDACQKSGEVASATAAPAPLTVWVGAPQVLAALPDQGLQVLVEADPNLAERWRIAWHGRQRLVVCDQVLAPESGVPVRWCLFNDARFNGPLDGQSWQAHLPNLRQVGEEQRLGRSLADLLTSVTEPMPQDPCTALHLRLQQGDPLAALQGLGAWLEQVSTVELAVPEAAAALWADQLAAWLVPRGFRAAEPQSARWQRDPIATQRLLLQERDQALARVQDLEAQLQLLSTRFEEQIALNDQQRQQLEHINRELDDLLAVLDQAMASAS